MKKSVNKSNKKEQKKDPKRGMIRGLPFDDSQACDCYHQKENQIKRREKKQITINQNWLLKKFLSWLLELDSRGGCDPAP